MPRREMMIPRKRPRRLAATMIAALTLPALCASHLQAQHQSDEDRKAPVMDARQRAALNHGEVVVSTEKVPGRLARKGYAVTLVEAPIERVWCVINDYDRFEEFMPSVTASEIEAAYEATVIHKCHVSVLAFGFDYTNKCVKNLKDWRVDWTYVQGDVADNTGFWHLEAWDEDAAKTKVTYSVFLDVGKWLPGFLQDLVQRQTLPDVLRAVRARVGDASYDEPARKVQDERRALLNPADQADLPQAPAIRRLSHAEVSPGDTLIVFGDRFLPDEQAPVVTLGQKALRAENVKDTVLIVQVPDDAESGALAVTTSVGRSNEISLTVRHAREDEGARGGLGPGAWGLGIAESIPISSFKRRDSSPARLPFIPSPFPLPTPSDADNNGVPDRFEQALAEKFAPCHAYAGPDIWACELSYLWAGGAPLMVRAGYADGRSVDRKLLDADRLTERSWASLPDDNGKEGAERIRFAYFFDIPGECTGPGPDDMTWDDEWRLIQGEFGVDVKKARFPPAYYAHFSWNDLEKGELVLQFWFYYPYDKWINNHEGDIEHITVLLQLEGEGEARFDPALDHQKVKGAVYRFHGKELELGAKDLIRIGARDRKQGDHVMVFVGGKGSDTLPFSKETWGGLYSGGSYPYPALFKGAGGWITNHDDTRTVARWIHAEDFRVIVLPEPDQIDYEARPDMSWFALNLFVGALETKPNHPIVAATGTGSPIQPGRKGSWNLYKDPTPLAYRRERAEAGAFSPPARWAVISAPESYRARAPKSE